MTIVVLVKDYKRSLVKNSFKRLEWIHCFALDPKMLRKLAASLVCRVCILSGKLNGYNGHILRTVYGGGTGYICDGPQV